MTRSSIVLPSGNLLFWLLAAVWCTGIGLSDALAQAKRTPLDEFKAFLSHPPAIEELILERHILTPLPAMIGTNQGVPAGNFFQIRFQTNAYFLRQMNSFAAAQKPPTAHEPVEGLWNGEYWMLLNNQLNLWPGNQSLERIGARTGPLIYGSFLGLGLDEQIIPSTIVWKGDEFTARGKGNLRFEGRIEEKTPAGLPKRIDSWSVEDPGTHLKVDYEYRPGIHPWLPAVIKPFRRIRLGEGRGQEFYVRSVKLGPAPNPQEAFSPQLYTNQNTLVIVYHHRTLQSVSRNGVPLPTGPPPGRSSASQTAPPAATSPAPIPPAPSPAPLSPPQPQPPAIGFNGWLILPLLLVVVFAAFWIDKIGGKE